MTRRATERMGVLGAVLAGGDSRRMGRDKALLPWQGGSLLTRAAAVLDRVAEEVVVLAPVDRGYRELGLEVVPDLRPGNGPLGGIHTALVRGGGRPVFILACDLPHVGAELVRWIIGGDAANGSGTPPMVGDASTVQVRLAADEHGRQPLCALYAPHCLEAVESALSQQCLSVLDLVDSLVSVELRLAPGAPWYRPDLLANINSAGPYARSIGGDRSHP
jgi:molybdopterin-guanine dinucleotide biosynthesis protein A